ncbi:type II secretion system protein GspJ [Pseudomonas rhodesiae]|uniref:type II secretion system protein GspJ n=1 Tax=Pseudomonas rhodesiae TaxID=76760 RepID=UPI0023EEDFB6|nr:type II secretion system protein GspJ [Pseudomonas rhodesiae]
MATAPPSRSPAAPRPSAQTFQQNSLQRVRWLLDGGTLYRTTSVASDRYPPPAPKQVVAVLSGVSELQVRVWKAGKGWHQLAGNQKKTPSA